MLNDLKFVQAAVAKKDYVPELTFFQIKDGRILGFNGVIAISTPTDLAVSAAPKATNFLKAMERAPEGEEVVLNLTQAGRLGVKAGAFRVYVECHSEQSYPDVSPEGEYYPLPGGILPVMRKLAPIMGVDASRPWAMGILFDGQSAFATNNIVLAEVWMDQPIPCKINIPAEAIKALINARLEPIAVQVSERSATFHYESGAWLRTSLGSLEWPDLAAVLNKPNNAAPIPDGFFEGVKRLDAFTAKDNRLHLRGGLLATSEHDGEGASVELPDFGGVGCHFLGQMAALDGIATHMDFSLYPAPCLFFGDQIRGAIVGMRINDAV